MPYSSNSELPASVRDALPGPAQSVFRRVVNDRLDAGASEESAFRTAWAAVKQGWKKEDGEWVRKYASPLYIRRNLENAAEFIEWAEGQGFTTTQRPHQMHVTIAYCKPAVEWPEPHESQLIVRSPARRSVERLGDAGAVALCFHSPDLTARWEELINHGCSSDYDSFKAHVTITWMAGDLDLSKVEPYRGDLIFGPEIFAELDEDWEPMAEKALSFEEALGKVGARHTRKEYQQIQAIHDFAMELGARCGDGEKHGEAHKADSSENPEAGKALDCKVSKVDASLGIVFGWAIVCKDGGEEYFDTQGDHIPEDAMLKAATDFMKTKRVMKVMHAGRSQGTVLFAFPLTGEIAKAMGIEAGKTGLMIGVKPDSQKILDKFANGEYTGFSIGGQRLEDETIEE